MSASRALATIAALFCLAAAADPAERLADPAREARARALFQEIRCVVCQNESIDDSEAALAADVRRMIRDEIAKGAANEQVRASLVRRYGEFILLKPRFSFGNAILWLTPFVIVVGGGGFFLVRSRPLAHTAEELTEEEERRLKRIDLN